MAHTRKHSILATKIVQGNKEIELQIKPNNKLTIGRSPDNDIVIYSDAYPKKHTLIECKKDTCVLNITPNMSGAIEYKNSKLDFNDLFLHNLLPRKGEFYSLAFGHGRTGAIKIADTIVYFNYDGAGLQPIKDMPGYTWKQSFSKTFSKDLLFKSLLTIFFCLEIFLAIKLKGYQVPDIEPPDMDKIPQRFAKFIINKPTPPPELELATSSGDGDGSSEEEQGEKKENEPKAQKSTGGSGGDQGNKPVVAQGLLGLIGGAGSSDNASATADFLIEQGLVKELDELIGSQKLNNTRANGRRGDGSGSGSGTGSGSGSGDGLDDLVALGLSGIDDLLPAGGGVEKVALQKKGNVNIEQPKQMRGSQAAQAQRTPQSVMSIINSQEGRIMYTYNKYLREDPNLRGKINIDITIEADGSVSNVAVLDTDIPVQEFIQDIISILRRLKFPAITEGAIQVNLPFVFNRVN
ncbi:MAG TPA: AgmX/PglI C-terminal domain-containing protein [bacterium]|nr:AgmX/PglI C-terminal domain-containing protein [bacterium]HPN44860.1 AgmX/PglI C-terminal domain-containing protein [bacterium]